MIMIPLLTQCLFNRFHDNIRCGPEYICTCCDQLWHRSSVIKCYASNYSNCEHSIVQSCITGLRSVHDTEWICNICHSNLKDGKCELNCDVNSTVHSLPRPISESQTIPIKLKRCLSYKHHYQFQNVRPMKVLEAARFLDNTSDLYKNEA